MSNLFPERCTRDMRKLLSGALALYFISSAVGAAQMPLLEQVNQLELKGQFKQAAGLLATALRSKSLPAPERNQMAFELDRLERIKKDFPYTKESLFADLK